MELDMETVLGSEDYEELQEYFEHRKFNFLNGNLSVTSRLKEEYVPDMWEELNEKDNISDKQRALRRIQRILEEIPSDCEESSISKTSFER